MTDLSGATVSSDSSDAARGSVERLTTLVTELQRRLERVEAEWAIVDVLYRYGTTLDDGDPAGWSEVFTEDGVWEVGGPAARIDFRLEGHEELRHFASNHSGAPTAWHKHCVVHPQVVVSDGGDRATSTCYTFRLDGLGGAPVVQSFGRYHDEFERGADGAWRIAHRRLVVEGSQHSPFGFQGGAETLPAD